MKTKTNTRYIVTGAIIAAMYAALTFLSNTVGLAFGPIQYRLSEALVILPIFTPAAIPGLVIGCLISNIFSFNIADMFFGTLATLLAAILTRRLRFVKTFNLPILSLLPPILFNAIIVGAEISLLYLEADSFIYGFIISAIEVGLSEVAVCFTLGIPLYLALNKKRNIF